MVQVDILVRPYTMDLMPLAKMLIRLNSWSTPKKGVLGNLTRFTHENGGTLAAEFLSKLGLFWGKLAKKTKKKGRIDEFTFQ